MSRLEIAMLKYCNWLRQNGLQKPMKINNDSFRSFLFKRANHNPKKLSDERLKEEQQQILAILKREFPEQIDEIYKIRWFTFGFE